MGRFGARPMLTRQQEEIRIDPELEPQIREAGRVHGAAIEHELPQGRQPGFGEEDARPSLRNAQLDQLRSSR